MPKKLSIHETSDSTSEFQCLTKDFEDATDEELMSALLWVISKFNFDPNSQHSESTRFFLENPFYLKMKERSDRYLKEADPQFILAVEWTYKEPLEEYVGGNKEVARVLFGFLVNGNDTITEEMDSIIGKEWDKENPERALELKGKKAFVFEDN